MKNELLWEIAKETVLPDKVTGHFIVTKDGMINFAKSLEKALRKDIASKLEIMANLPSTGLTARCIYLSCAKDIKSGSANV
jgi:hypothetical protein